MRCANVPMHGCSYTLVQWCICAQMHPCTDVSGHLSTDALVHSCTDAPVHVCTVHQSINTFVLICNETAMHPYINLPFNTDLHFCSIIYLRKRSLSNLISVALSFFQATGQTDTFPLTRARSLQISCHENSGRKSFRVPSKAVRGLAPEHRATAGVYSVNENIVLPTPGLTGRAVGLSHAISGASHIDARRVASVRSNTRPVALRRRVLSLSSSIAVRLSEHLRARRKTRRERVNTPAEMRTRADTRARRGAERCSGRGTLRPTGVLTRRMISRENRVAGIAE